MTLALVLLAVLALLVVLAARVDAAPRVVAPVMAPESDRDLDAEADDADADPDPDPDPVTGSAAAAAAATATAIATGDAAGAPPIAEVLAAVYAANSLDSPHDRSASWRWRTRLAALAPAITVRDGRDATWRDIADPTIAYVSVFSVSATWRLDRLVFDANELRISAIDAARRRERRHLGALTVHFYYRWLRTGDPEAAAELDVLSAGWFSSQLSEKR